MPAPTPASRTSPSGKPLNQGYQVVVNNSLDSDLEFFEEGVTPPAIMGQDELETTTQFNVTWQTFAPQSLMRLMPYTMRGKVDPILYQSFPLIANINATITLHLPNGDSLAHYGFYKSLEFSEFTRGSRPEGTITVVPTNQDPTDCSEQGPVYTAGTGTEPC
jgi:hypothetical protein